MSKGQILVDFAAFLRAIDGLLQYGTISDSTVRWKNSDNCELSTVQLNFLHCKVRIEHETFFIDNSKNEGLTGDLVKISYSYWLISVNIMNN